MVEDDGVSYKYIKNDIRTTNYSWNDQTKTLTWKVNGNYSGSNVYKNIKIILGNQERNAVIGKSGRVGFK